MKEQLLNNGLEHTENKHMTISDLKTGFILLLIALLGISTSTAGYFYIKSKKIEYSLNRSTEINAINQSTINELTHDNLNLVNNK